MKGINSLFEITTYGFIMYSILFILASVFSAHCDFRVYWNVPSEICSKNFGINVTQSLLNHNILVNNGETFIGDKITIFYDTQLGYYPRIDPKKGDINGGLPQLADLDRHLRKAETDLINRIPNDNFDGLGVIDWESWRPVWETNWSGIFMYIYRRRSLDLVKQKYPNMSPSDIEKMAKEEWEKSAKEWMLKTLQLAQQLRPNRKWCYYLYPDCYNYQGKDKPSQYLCSDGVQKFNDRLSWLWSETSALCPSIYILENHLTQYNFTQRVWWTYGRLAESIRVSQQQTEHYPYINYIFPGTKSTIPEQDFSRMLGQIGALGLDGAVIWGSSNNVKTKDECEELKNYVDSVIGPAVSTVVSNVNRCSNTICNGRGRCTWPGKEYTSWRYLTNFFTSKFDPDEITCKCRNLKSKHCN